MRAANQLHKEIPGCSITLVDREPINASADHIHCICGDGTAWLLKNFTPDASVSKIIPAVPLHTAAYWLQGKLSAEDAPVYFRRIPKPLIDQFPNPFPLEDNSVAISYADFICPPDCPEPEEFCTHTGLPRQTPLYRYLETINCGPFQKLILQSRQFAPGVGGFFPDDLWQLLERARALSGEQLLTSTACKCHGIASLLCPVKTRSN